MKCNNLCFLAFFGLICLAAPLALAEKAANFEALMAESGLSFTQPEGTAAGQPLTLSFFGFDKAYKLAKPDMEIHYAIRPISRMQTTSYDAHGVTPEPNFLYTMIFKSLSSNLAEGARNHRRNYSSQLAQELFHASWASASQFRIAKNIGSKYARGILLAIHKKDKADAFTLFLFNDGKAAKPIINKFATSLKFKADKQP